MDNCCISLAKESPLLKGLCDIYLNKPNASCEKLDISYCSNTYSTGIPEIECFEKDGNVSPAELLKAVLSQNLYFDVTGKAIFNAMEAKGIAPPWILKDSTHLKELYGLKAKAKNEEDLLKSAKAYLGEKIKYAFGTGEPSNADKALDKGKGNCLDMAIAFHGIAEFLGIKDSFYIRYANNWALFHVLNGVDAGKNVHFIDNGGGDPSAHKEDITYKVTTEEFFARYIIEKIRSSDTSLSEKVASMREVFKWSPLDFSIPFNIGITILENGGKNEDAESYFGESLKLNPFYAPAVICFNDPATCLQKLK